jgi:predicted phosphoribosyltransferase
MPEESRKLYLHFAAELRQVGAMAETDETRRAQTSASRRDPALLLADLRSAGRTLASKLEEFRNCENALVLGLVRGGVPAAVEVAAHLALPLDVVLVRKLLAPNGPDSPICAANVAGHPIRDPRLDEIESTEDTGLKFFLADAFQSLAIRAQVCRGERPPTDISGKTILLIDNGARTGATLQAAVKAIRQLKPAMIIVAIPVGSPESRPLLEDIADALVCVAWRDPFGHVGMWYAKYDVPQVEDVCTLLEEGNRAPR